MKQYKVTVNGTVYDVTVEEAAAAFLPTPPTAVPVAAPAPAAAPAPVAAPAPAPVSAPAPAPVSAGGTQVKAPIPGNILDLKVKVGDTVKAGDVLCVLEAMKMENDITSPSNGTVSAVQVSKGASVDTGDLLFVLS